MAGMTAQEIKSPITGFHNIHKHNNNLHYGVTDIRHTNKQINKLTGHKLKQTTIKTTT